jgi:hypothetical protein
MAQTPSLAATTALLVITAQLRHPLLFHALPVTIPAPWVTSNANNVQLVPRVPSPTLTQLYALTTRPVSMPTLLMLAQQDVTQMRVLAYQESTNGRVPVLMEKFVQRAMPVIIVSQHLNFVLEGTTLT